MGEIINYTRLLYYTMFARHVVCQTSRVRCGRFTKQGENRRTTPRQRGLSELGVDSSSPEEMTGHFRRSKYVTNVAGPKNISNTSSISLNSPRGRFDF